MILGLKCKESKAIYERTNELMEKIDKILCLTIVGVSLGFVVPKAIVSYFNYYISNTTTNDGTDAFDLPMPIW